MLTRGQSDFEWFRNRTKTFNTDLFHEPAAMATLNPEPAAPEERAEIGLPPKSYAKATKEPYEKQRQENKTANEDSHHSQTNGTPEKPQKSNTNGMKDENERNLDEQRVIFEKHANGQGEVLTSIKPDPIYEAGLQHDEKVAPKRRSSGDKKNKDIRQDVTKSEMKDDLSSGRKAGAGWQTSAYVKS